MPLTDPTDIPSLDRVFGANTFVMNAFKQAEITSVVPVMLLPRQLLINDIAGIGEHRAAFIAQALADHGLQQRDFHERLSDFIDRQFGCIEDAPIAVLTVVRLRDTVMTRPHYAPLQLIQLLEEVNPHLKVLDLLESTEDELFAMIEEKVVFGPIMRRLRGDLTDVNWRLSQWDVDCHVGVLHGVRQKRLRLVHSK